MNHRKLVLISGLLFLALTWGCASSNGLERQRRLEATVAALQTDVVVQATLVRSLLETPEVMATATSTSSAQPVIPTVSPSPSPSPSPTPRPAARVTADMLNLRGGPGTEYDRVVLLREGMELRPIGKVAAGDWLLVIAPDGVEGWVSVRYIELGVPLESLPVVTEIPPTPTPAPVPTETPTPSA